MISVLYSLAEDFKFDAGPIKSKKIKCNCCFPVKHTALNSKNKGLLAQSQDNVIK